MVTEVFNCFIAVLGRCAAMLFNLPLTAGVSVGSFFVAAAVMGVVISVVFAGIRSFVGLYNSSRDGRRKPGAEEE